MAKGTVVAGRPGKSVLDGKSHIRQPQLGYDRAVAKLDEGVDQALGMDDDIDGLIGHIKQPVRFYNFQPFIGQCSAVYGHFGPHIPVWVLEALLSCYMEELLFCPAPERTA